MINTKFLMGSYADPEILLACEYYVYKIKVKQFCIHSKLFLLKSSAFVHSKQRESYSS
jgi:hypothetical protein